MAEEILPPAGGYAAAPGWLQYSRGVRALPGHAIVRVRFQDLIPLDAGFTRIAAWLRRSQSRLRPVAGRPRQCPRSIWTLAVAKACSNDGTYLSTQRLSVE
jgi:hypothetical protein